MEASWWERLTVGKLGLVLMRRAMFSKSLIQFSVDGRCCVPSPPSPRCLIWDQSVVEVMKIMAISFKMTHAHTGPLSAPDPAASHCWPTPLPETPRPSQACLGQCLVGSWLLSPGSWCTQGFVCALQESASPVLCKFYSQIPSKSNSLGVLNCFARSPGWEICSGS